MLTRWVRAGGVEQSGGVGGQVGVGQGRVGARGWVDGVGGVAGLVGWWSGWGGRVGRVAPLR